MTELDKFEPDGEPIHPFDLFELLQVMGDVDLFAVASSPAPADEADYQRNLHKSGSVVVLNGKRYFETTTEPYRTRRFVESTHAEHL